MFFSWTSLSALRFETDQALLNRNMPKSIAATHTDPLPVSGLTTTAFPAGFTLEFVDADFNGGQTVEPPLFEAASHDMPLEIGPVEPVNQTDAMDTIFQDAPQDMVVANERPETNVAPPLESFAAAPPPNEATFDMPSYVSEPAGMAVDPEPTLHSAHEIVEPASPLLVATPAAPVATEASAAIDPQVLAFLNVLASPALAAAPLADEAHVHNASLPEPSLELPLPATTEPLLADLAVPLPFEVSLVSSSSVHAAGQDSETFTLVPAAGTIIIESTAINTAPELVTQALPLAAPDLPAALLPAITPTAFVPPASAARVDDVLPTITGPSLFAIEITGSGSGTIDLADGYHLVFDENRSELVIENRVQNEATRIWGEAIAGSQYEQALQFWGTSTFELANGTKVTVETKESAANRDVYTFDKVTISKDHRAVILTGLDADTRGDVRIDQSTRGWDIEEDTRDGFTMLENETGSGWLNEDPGEVVTQVSLNETAVGQSYAPGSTEFSLGELQRHISRFITTSWTLAFMADAQKTFHTDARQQSSADDERRSLSRNISEKRAIELQAMKSDFQKMSIILDESLRRAPDDMSPP